MWCIHGQYIDKWFKFWLFLKISQQNSSDQQYYKVKPVLWDMRYTNYPFTWCLSWIFWNDFKFIRVNSNRCQMTVNMLIFLVAEDKREKILYCHISQSYSVQSIRMCCLHLNHLWGAPGSHCALPRRPLLLVKCTDRTYVILMVGETREHRGNPHKHRDNMHH